MITCPNCKGLKFSSPKPGPDGTVYDVMVRCWRCEGQGETESRRVEVMAEHIGPRPGGNDPPMLGLHPHWDFYIKVDGEEIHPIECEATTNERGRPTIVMHAKVPA